MKTLLKLMALFFVTGLILASCKTASITKRHYNKGYYISHSGKKGKINPAVATKSTRQAAPATPIENPTKPLDESVAESPAIGKTIAAATETSAETHNAPLKREVNKTERDEYEKDFELSKANVKAYVKNPFSLAKAVATKDAGSDALSLIWILIVVLLIIYIAGLLLDDFGLGGVFHILAVIILVLLILWLLRII